MKKHKKTWLLILIILFPTCLYSSSRSKLLDGIVIVIDAGHGGKDQGASSNGVYEAELNLKIVLQLKKQIESLGAQVVLTRKDENDLSNSTSKNKKKEDFKQRLQIINDEKNDLMISIHMNIFNDSSVHGAHVFYKKDSKSSLNLANDVQFELNQSMNQEKSIKIGYFYLLENARIPSILVECGFLSNDEDRKKLQDEHHQEKVVNAIVQGILTYYEIYI